MKKYKLTKFQILLILLNILLLLVIVCYNRPTPSPSLPPDTAEPPETSGHTGDSPELDPFYKNFSDFNKNQTRENTMGFLYFRSTASNLKKLFKELDGANKTTTADYPLEPGTPPLSITVIDTFTTEEESDFVPSGELWVKFNKSKSTHAEDGKLQDDYIYYVAELKVTNTSGNNIDLIMTNPAMAIHFLDNNGERFWYSPCVFFSYQPGENERNAAKLFDFKNGDSFTSKYAFIVPKAALKYYNCCLTVSASGDTSCDPDYTAMLITDRHTQ